MKVAIVGTGISGMVAAYLMQSGCELTVFEAADRIGGHTNTVDVTRGDRTFAVDTGFIVFNERTYPNFIQLLGQLGVGWKNTEMSFSVRSDATGLEYNGTSLNALFAQRSNLVRPSFWRMVRDILRFYREARGLLDSNDDSITLGEYLRQNRYSKEFVRDHIVPMGAAVWSARPEAMDVFPARYLVRFFENHGFLQVEGRPQWLVVEGGSRTYAEALTASFRDRIRLSTPVREIRRRNGGVELTTRDGSVERFDEVIIAAHSDQALRMLQDPSDLEREVLGAFQYQPNEAVLHTDASLLPRRPLARAAWNYHIPVEPADRATVTYWMNALQGIDSPEPFCVTLNCTDRIDPQKILRRFDYHHPVYTPAAVAAQARHAEISGVNGVHYCGAYWGFGFHEDGVKSALQVGRMLGKELASV